MNKLSVLVLVFLMPLAALAHPQAADLTCGTEEGGHVLLHVSNSPAGDGGLTLQVGALSYTVEQEGYQTNYSGNVKWGKDGSNRMTQMTYVNAKDAVNFKLSDVPLNIKYDFLWTPNGYFSHAFDATLWCQWPPAVTFQVKVKCTYVNVAGMNN